MKLCPRIVTRLVSCHRGNGGIRNGGDFCRSSVRPLVPDGESLRFKQRALGRTSDAVIALSRSSVVCVCFVSLFLRAGELGTRRSLQTGRGGEFRQLQPVFEEAMEELLIEAGKRRLINFPPRLPSFDFPWTSAWPSHQGMCSSCFAASVSSPCEPGARARVPA